MDQDVEDFIYFTIQAHSYLPTLVRIVPDGAIHTQNTSDWDASFQHVELFVVRFIKVFPEDTILFLDFH
jgi:hypothetical protein